MPYCIKNGINANGKNMNGKEINAAFFMPNVFTKVGIPVLLSASLSTISLVVMAPIKNTSAIVPMTRGSF